MPQNLAPNNMIGNHLCYTHLEPTDGVITITAKLDCMGSVLSIVITGSGSILTVCEVQVYADPYNMCKLFFYYFNINYPNISYHITIAILLLLDENGLFKRAGYQINIPPFRDIQVDVMDDYIIMCYVLSSCKAVHLPQTLGSSSLPCQLFMEFDLFSNVSTSTVWDMFEKST